MKTITESLAESIWNQMTEEERHQFRHNTRDGRIWLFQKYLPEKEVEDLSQRELERAFQSCICLAER